MDGPPLSDLTGDVSFAAPAKIRVLLTPVGRTAAADRQFEHWAALVRRFSALRLADLPRSARPRASVPHDSPLARKGEVHISFVTSYDPSHAFLAPFSLSHTVLAVVGLATATPAPLADDAGSAAPAPAADNSAFLADAAAELRAVHPGALLHRVFAFDAAQPVPDTPDPAGDLGAAQDDEAPPVWDDSATNNATGGWRAGRKKEGEYDPNSQAEKDKLQALHDQLLGAGLAQSGLPPPDAEDKDEKQDDLLVIPAQRADGKDVRHHVKAVLADVISTLLDQLEELVANLKGVALETPRDTLDGGLYSLLSSSREREKTDSPPLQSPEEVGETVFGVAPDQRASSATWDKASSLFSFGGKPEPPTGTPIKAIGGGQQPESLQFHRLSLTPRSSSTTLSRPPSVAPKRISSSWRRSTATTTGGSGPQGEGRHTKIMADVYLLSGDLWSAMAYYDLSMKWMGKERSLAGGRDAVWFASALEGWAVTRALMARLGKGVEDKATPLTVALVGKEKDKEQAKREKEKDGTAELPYEGLPWESIAKAYTVALSIYAKCLSPLSVLLAPAKAVSSDSPTDFTHPLIHATACVQYARFLLAIWSCRGWNGECFDQLLYGGTPLLLRGEGPAPDEATLIRWSLDAGVRRDEVAAATSQALTLSVPALKARDQVSVLSSMASIFGWIGFVRRETYLLRRLLASVMDWMHAAASAGVELLQIRLGEVAPGLHVIYSPHRGKADYDALLVLAAQVCDTYGIQLDEMLRHLPEDHALARTREVRRLTSLGSLRPEAARQMWARDQYRPLEANTDLHAEAFGWDEVQALVVKDALAIAESINDPISMAVFASVLLRDFAPLLPRAEQANLMSGLTALVRANPETFVSNAGSGKTEVQYWGPRELVCKMDLLSLSETRKVTERTLPLETSRVQSLKQMLVVSDDELTTSVVLYNPLDVPLPLTELRLLVTGVRFDSTPSSATVPPKSFLRLRLTGTPRETGTLHLVGVRVTLQGCAPEDVRMTPLDATTELAWTNAQADLHDRRLRSKFAGLHSRFSRMPARPVEGFEDHVSVKVALPQPYLELESMSLPEGKLVLYEGETRTVRLHLRNAVPPNAPRLAVNYIALGLEDNLSSLARSTLAEGGLTPAATHALEYRLITRPVLQREGDASSTIIPPNEVKSVAVHVFGRAGVMAATISVEYGYIPSEGQKFYTRQLKLAFPVEVVRVIQPLAWALRPLMVNDLTGLMTANGSLAPFDAEENEAMGAALAQAADETGGDDMALISLDVKNVHPVRDLTVGLAYAPAGVTVSDSDGVQVTPPCGQQVTFQRLVPPGQRCRLVLPMPRLALPPGVEQSPIPSLSARQFTVAREGLSETDDRLMRRKFWYTHLLYAGLRCFWHLPPAQGGGESFAHGPHEGILLLREVQDWSDAQIDLLRALPLSIVLSSPTPTRRGDFTPLTAQITNSLPRPVKLLYRLTPLPAAALDPNGAPLAPGAQQIDAATHPTDPILRHILPAAGSLTTRVFPWPLPPGATTTVTKSLAFLASGQYAFVAAVEEVPPAPTDEDDVGRADAPPVPEKDKRAVVVDDGGAHTRVVAVSRNRLELSVE